VTMTREQVEQMPVAWRTVADEQPPFDTLVLAWGPGMGMQVAALVDATDFRPAQWTCRAGMFGVPYDVDALTHWTPLPVGPLSEVEQTP
jgi:hypothetical protein